MKEPQDDCQTGMGKCRFRAYLILITFGISLLVALLNLNIVFNYFVFFLGLITPILIGLAFAFILNIPMSFIENKLLGFIDKTPPRKKKKALNRDKVKRFLAIMLTIILILGVVVGIFTFLIPQLVASVESLVEQFPDYYRSFKEWTDQVLATFRLPSGVWDQLSTQWMRFLKDLVIIWWTWFRIFMMQQFLSPRGFLIFSSALSCPFIC